MNKFVDLSSKLSIDYEKLYENCKYTDISIYVGKEPNSKIFLAHTVVLCARSAFFENKLMDEIQKAAITVTFEDLEPDVFEILLRYIYTGQMSYDVCKNVGWISLLDGANKLELFDLLGTLETFLIDKQKEWIQRNIVTVHKYAASTVALNKLLDYCNQLMVVHPEIIFKSNDFATLPKENLLALLKNDVLTMNEDDIWMSVLQWATKQVPELHIQLGNNLDDWSPDNINKVKDIIADFIPHIRFFSVSSDKIVSYYDLIPRKLGRDLLNYQMDKAYKPSIPILPPRTGQGCHIDSLIIDKEQATWISSMIVESTTHTQSVSRKRKEDDVYRFTLLYRQSRDGATVAKFRELCNNKGPTITVGKVLKTEEILGGYNPLAWGIHSNSNSHSNSDWVDTKNSFIFALDKNMNKNTASFVGDSTHAIRDVESHFPAFGKGIDLYFGNGALRPYARKDSYQVAISSSDQSFEWVNWEVFLVSKKLI